MGQIGGVKSMHRADRLALRRTEQKFKRWIFLIVAVAVIFGYRAASAKPNTDHVPDQAWICRTAAGVYEYQQWNADPAKLRCPHTADEIVAWQVTP